MIHLQHPTQSAACGTSHDCVSVCESDFRQAKGQCKRCKMVLLAKDAGRSVFRGRVDKAIKEADLPESDK